MAAPLYTCEGWICVCSDWLVCAEDGGDDERDGRSGLQPRLPLQPEGPPPPAVCDGETLLLPSSEGRPRLPGLCQG